MYRNRQNHLFEPLTGTKKSKKITDKEKNSLHDDGDVVVVVVVVVVVATNRTDGTKLNTIYEKTFY